MSNIIIGNPDTYEKKIQLLNTNNLIIVPDFDHTITAARWASASSFDLLGTIPRLQGNFEEERAALYKKYRPYEEDPSLTKEIRDMWMQQWWKEAAELHKKYRLKKTDLDEIDYSRSVIRDSWKEFLSFCHGKRIPVHILSAWIGQIITGILHHNNIHHSNMGIIANNLIWDADNYTIWTNPNPPIYTGNKQDHTVDGTGKQIILFWDGIDDASMAHPKHDETTIRVAFYNPWTMRTIEEYLTKFDVVIRCSEPRSDEWYLETLMHQIKN